MQVLCRWREFLDKAELVTIIVPVYNRAHLMDRSIRSLCAQSYTNIEILIVDDASTDDIDAAVAAIPDPRVRLVRRPKNGGAAAARNTGVAEAKGNLVAFHDSDDICVFDKIERQVAHLAELPSDYIGTTSSVIFYYSLSEADYPMMKVYVRPYTHEAPFSGDLSARTLHGNSFHLPTLLVKKSALIAAGPSDELIRNNVDWDLALRLTRQGKLGFSAEPLYLMQVHLSAEINQQRISRSTKFSAASFVRITGKIRHQGHGGPDLAMHYTNTARHLLRLNRPGFARRYLRAALAITPLKPKLWVHYAFSYSPRLHAYVQARRRAHP
jgi:glycosyltransferase involved in cell wall biosynthesis